MTRAGQGREDAGGRGYSLYHTVWHNECRPLTRSIRVALHTLLSCRVFDHGLRKSCRECGHDWKSYLRVWSEYRTKREYKLDPKVERLVDEKISAERLQAAALECFEREIKQCEAENLVLKMASEDFARYLNQNSIVPYNYERVPLIDYQLQAGDIGKQGGDGGGGDDSSSVGEEDVIRRRVTTSFHFLISFPSGPMHVS